jgi:peptide/nickel transport system ATP-binding protein
MVIRSDAAGLRVRDLRVHYDGGDTPALRGIDLDLTPGIRLGLIGESGSGKSTLARALLRALDPTALVEGTISLDGVDLGSSRREELDAIRWRRIAIAFQAGLDTMNPVRTVGAHVAEPLRRHGGLRGRALAERVESLLSLVGLAASMSDVYPHQMSGGQRQLVSIATALALEPDYLILDEPASALDADQTDRLVALLNRLQRERGNAVLTISHDVRTVTELSDRVQVMLAGTVVEHAPTDRLLDEPTHPYTRGLLSAVPALAPHRDLRGIRGEGTVPPVGRCVFVGRCTQELPECSASEPELVAVGGTAGRHEVACVRGGIVDVLVGRRLDKTFRRGRERIRACRACDVTVRSGETVALIGASGSGKSTLAGMLAGTIDADAGEVVFRREVVVGNSATSTPGGLQFVHQDPAAAVTPTLPVRLAVREPLDASGTFRRERRDREVCGALEAVGLPTDDAWLARRVRTLSGGQRQRVALARALVMEPAVLIADEITSMLDPSTAASVVRLLEQLQHDRGFAMLLVTHDLHLAAKIADRFVVMSDGEIVDHGTAATIAARGRDATATRIGDVVGSAGAA